MPQQNKLGKHATSIYRANDYITIILHNTPIVKFNSREIVLNTGGWFTPTTKTRMNQASAQFNLKYHVYQKNYGWFVEYYEKTIPFENNTLTIKVKRK